MQPLRKSLQANRYPGRSVVWARTLDGAMCGGYLLTGRSQASKERALRLVGQELVVGPPDPTPNDPLRHYVAATQRDSWLVFGNGEQVATVADRLQAGRPPVLALDGLDYEPDPPIFTPRITVPDGGAWTRRDCDPRGTANLRSARLTAPVSRSARFNAAGWWGVPAGWLPGWPGA
ncbi:IMP cyclohydrolase [Nonomuraea polychroma]|uniref:IMP cyclohydrolase n=1 Tax=Nonomuraea polychroma TaxID=46176 RepID=UPI003D92C049